MSVHYLKNQSEKASEKSGSLKKYKPRINTNKSNSLQKSLKSSMSSSAQQTKKLSSFKKAKQLGAFKKK